MRRDNLTLPLGLRDELIIDNFAGGGGASTGIEQASAHPYPKQSWPLILRTKYQTKT